MKKVTDDYRWDNYTQDEYEWQVFDLIQNQHKQDLLITETKRDKNDDLVFVDNLHPNWMEVYHFVDKLKVNSVYEVGCGCAQHLINIRKTNPTIKIGGSDYAKSQIDLGFANLGLFDYDFANDLQVIDMTKPLPEGFDTYELVFTQTVTMHLSYDRAKKVLENMGKISEKYIVLIDNISQHDYPTLVRETLPDFEVINEKKYIHNTIILKRK